MASVELLHPEQKNPEAVIEELRQEVAAMGRNDSEFSRFDQIIERLRTGESTPEEALQEARGVRNNKQDH